MTKTLSKILKWINRQIALLIGSAATSNCIQEMDEMEHNDPYLELVHLKKLQLRIGLMIEIIIPITHTKVY